LGMDLGMSDAFDGQGETVSAVDSLDLEILGDSFIERLEAITRALEKASSGLSSGLKYLKEAYEGDSEDDEEDDAEYAEAYGGSKEELKKYAEKFREYAREVRRAVEEMYGEKPDSGGERKANGDEDQRLKSPAERGHKLGCGCPGCTAYREFFGIKLDDKNNPHGGLDPSPLAASGKKKKDAGEYRETNSRPCGGRLYHHFHGKHGELKNVFGRYTGRFNFGRAGY
jgi:hypothetical protein